MKVILKTPMKILISYWFTKVRLHPIVPSIASLTSSSTSSSSWNSSKSNSSLDTEDDSEQVDPQNVTVAGTNSQKPEEREERSRKRIRKPAKWKSKVAKVLRDSRKAYQSFSKSKKQVPQRKVGPPCGEKCRLKCKDKIDEMGQQLFDAFWGLGNLERQR
ncbi:hypothetical protein HNY73_016818 [Argiope bruennichi]|uniref:Uncharacterized protein n=1 Tax=Argiope bruennichi TaxID=94029 RepID=A0A8T0ENK0_ARGBR|nr:hypothetical protein HNY73_016818 [Argiope bruennichi]